MGNPDEFENRNLVSKIDKKTNLCNSQEINVSWIVTPLIMSYYEHEFERMFWKNTVCLLSSFLMKTLYIFQRSKLVYHKLIQFCLLALCCIAACQVHDFRLFFERGLYFLPTSTICIISHSVTHCYIVCVAICMQYWYH